ncbi:MAG TPA: twin-arginine translocase subunit TatC [Chromatiaceae bacterium]|nr:twin-arginine translocase subunit TatC [Chromatiaceae bacterium]
MASQPDASDIEQPFLSHLLELRDRLLRMVAAIAVIFLALFPFANDIYAFIAKPLMDKLPQGTSMIATEVASPFLTPFKLTLVASIFLAIPVILHQIWSFIAPGLYRHEKRLAVPLLVSSTLLFYLGMIFAYFVVFPLVFQFLTGTVPEGVAVATDISRYLDFVLTLFFAFGIAFEIPIATILLVLAGVTTPDKLAQKRPYVFLGTFVVGMLLTPPDVISQTLLAVPMWLLFEAGVFFSRFVKRHARSGAKADAVPVAAAASAVPATPAGDDGFVPLSDAEMEAELDRIEDEEDDYDPEDENDDTALSSDESDDPVERKLRQAHAFRQDGDDDVARELLHEVLAEGDEHQRLVARNVLQQMDDNAE